MSHVSYSRIVTMFVTSMFVTQALAQDVDDNSEKLKMYSAAAAKTAACQALPFDVSKSIILADGNPIVLSPAAMEPFMNDVNMKVLMQNCITTVTNSNETIGQKDQVSSALMAKLRNSAMKFVSLIAAFANKYKDSAIGEKVTDPVATIGIRG